MKQRNTLITALVFLILSLSSFAQKADYKLTHHMTPEEEKLRHLIGKDFYPTMPPAPPVRMLAEFERMQSVLVRYPFGIPYSLIAEMSEDCGVLTIVTNQSQEDLVRSYYLSNGVNLDNCEFMHAQSDSYWTRDYGPWFVVDGNHDVGVCNFPYNRPRPNDNDIPIEVADYYNIELYGMELVQTGGNWMCDGLRMASSTDLVIEENPNMTIAQIDTKVLSYLGVHTYNKLLDPLGEYIKHIDCWGKYLDVDKVLIGQVPASDPRYSDFEYIADFFANQISSYGTPYQVFRVYTPGDYPYTPYTNSLILNDKVFVPQTGSTHDAAALQAYEDAMPGYEIIGIMHDSWENTDALHCRAKGIADLGMLYIKHIPLLGEVPQQDPFEITAEIIPYSGDPLYPDSLLIYYKVDGGNFTTSSLYFVSGYTYSGDIPVQTVGSEIAYYLHAADESGRSENHPFIGAADPHVFTVTEPLPDVTVYPDTLLFVDEQSCLLGLPAIVKNDSDSTVTINYINNEGWEEFHWYIDPWTIGLPYDLDSGDSLELLVHVDLPVTDLITYYQDTLFVETDASTHEVLIRVDNALISTGYEEIAVAEEISMQVFPNPVNSNSGIEITMPETAMVNISLYDMSGRESKVVYDNLLAEGKHRLAIPSVEGLEKGIYIVRMVAGDTVISRKLIVMD